MAIINTYPKATPKGADLLIGTQVKDDNITENSTKSFSVSSIGSFLITSNDITTGSGTTNTLPVWTDGPNGVLGDSIITYDDTSTPTITIGPQPSKLIVDGDLIVNNRAVFDGPYARFNSPIEDGSNSPGTTGQLLTSTVTGVEWVDPHIRSEKIIVSTAELRDLHNTPKILVDVTAGNPKEICQVYSVIFTVNGNYVDNNLEFPNDINIESEYTSPYNTSPWKYIIPQSIANKLQGPSGNQPYYNPSLTAGTTLLDYDVVLSSAGAAVETGTATTTMTVWITYRIFNIAD